MSVVNSTKWDEYNINHPKIHLLQTRAWGDLKSAFGWSVRRIVVGDVGVQILIKRLFPGIRMAYIPRGPWKDAWTILFPEINDLCRKESIAFLKIEPDQWEHNSLNLQQPQGFIRSFHNIQPPRTLLIDLDGDEKTVMGRMKQKTRYNINLALKKGVVVRTISDTKLFHSLLEITSDREQFGVHSLQYYQLAYDLFHPICGCELFLAEFDNSPLAVLMAFAQGDRAWYLYGGSSNLHRDRMPTYLIQWEAIRWAKSLGCREYDLWGIPDVNETELEANFLSKADGLWGVYRFKRGFGGDIRRSIGPFDKIYNPLLYKLYKYWIQARKTKD